MTGQTFRQLGDTDSGDSGRLREEPAPRAVDLSGIEHGDIKLLGQGEMIASKDNRAVGKKTTRLTWKVRG